MAVRDQQNRENHATLLTGTCKRPLRTCSALILMALSDISHMTPRISLDFESANFLKQIERIPSATGNIRCKRLDSSTGNCNVLDCYYSAARKLDKFECVSLKGEKGKRRNW